MKSYQEFFAELKRRHVFRVAAIYGVVAFGVLQAADIALPRLGLPDWTVTFMLALILLAFPIALLLAWAFEVTPDGVRKTEAPAPGELQAIIEAPASKRWPAGLLALAGVAALVASTWWLARRTAPPPLTPTSTAADGTGATARDAMNLVSNGDDERPSLAVLPFADMSPEGDQEYFSDGITEEILSTLARIRDIKVAARTSAFAFKGRQVDLRDVGDSLGVGYLIEGSVRKSGEQLRITAQLIDARDGSRVWGDNYDREIDDIFAIQGEIARAIADALLVPLGLEEADDLVSPTGDLQAYDLYLSARARLRERGPGVPEAIRLFEAAVARDSTWAPAWAGLAEATEISTFYPRHWEESLEEPFQDRARWRAGTLERLDPAEEAARRALALDPNNASALVALGSVHRGRFEWEEAEGYYRRALALDPDNAEAFLQFGEMLTGTGRAREGAPLLRHAADLDPAPVRLGMAGWVLLQDDRIPEGIEALSLVVEAQERGELPLLSRALFRAMLYEGRLDEAEDVARRHLGRNEIDVVAALRADDPSRLPEPAHPYYLVLLGELDRAVEAYRQIGDDLVLLDIYELWHPAIDAIRSRAGMEPVLRRANIDSPAAQRSADRENTP